MKTQRIDDELKELTLQRSGYMRAKFALENKIGAVERRLKSAGAFSDLALLTTTIGFSEAIEVIDRNLKEVEKDISVKAASHPMYQFVLDHKGIGPKSFAAIVGECGSLLNYDNPAKVFKRMGLAVMDGTRIQKRGKTKQEFIDWGYSKRRRTWMYLLTEAIEKQTAGNGSVYKDLYVERKAYEKAKNEAGDYKEQAAEAISEKNIGKTTVTYKAYAAGKLPDAHINMRVKRFVAKRILRDMWNYWRDNKQLIKVSV